MRKARIGDHAPQSTSAMETAQGGHAKADQNPKTSVAPKHRFKRRFRDFPEMNIPSEFLVVAIPVMIFT